MKHNEVRHPANRTLYGDFVERVKVDTTGAPEVHRKDCRCIGCVPRQPNDELYAKLKSDPWR